MEATCFVFWSVVATWTGFLRVARAMSAAMEATWTGSWRVARRVRGMHPRKWFFHELGVVVVALRLLALGGFVLTQNWTGL